jgi:hypothetical protein
MQVPGFCSQESQAPSNSGPGFRSGSTLVTMLVVECRTLKDGVLGPGGQAPSFGGSVEVKDWEAQVCHGVTHAAQGDGHVAALHL